MTRDAIKYKNINLKRVNNINKIEKFTKEKVKIKEIHSSYFNFTSCYYF